MKMDTGEWWSWVWQLFVRCSRVDIEAHSVGAGERWAIVFTTAAAGLRAYCLRPARDWLLGTLPRWVAVVRLEWAGHGWYRIPSQSAAEHARLRFDVFPIQAGDLIRLKDGRPTAVAYAGPASCEIIFLEANGEIEPDPIAPLLGKAWSAYRDAHRKDHHS